MCTAHLDPATNALVVWADDPSSPLRDLLAWVDRHHFDVSRLEVGPPSLEDAYLAAIGGPLILEGTPR